MTIRSSRDALAAFAGLCLLSACASTGATAAAGYPYVPPANFSHLVAGAASPGGLASPPVGMATSDWLAAWPDGPVSMILTVEERERYAGLDTDPERAEFVRLFWHRRNPEPAQEYNESLQEFERRVAAANALFASDERPGWRTRFGRTMLVLGFPTIVRVGDKDGPRADTTEAVPVKGGERVFWQYGLRAEDLTGTSLRSAALLSNPPALPAGAQMDASYFVTFAYVRGGWSLACGSGWLADSLGEGWGPVLQPGYSNFGGGRGGSAGGVPGAVASVGESASPDVAGSGGVYVGNAPTYGGGGPSLGRRFAPACSDLFGSARAAWLYNTVYYP